MERDFKLAPQPGSRKLLDSPIYQVEGAPDAALLVPVEAIDKGQCHWVLGDAPVLCGLPVVADRCGKPSSWCEHHYGIVFPWAAR